MLRVAYIADTEEQVKPAKPDTRESDFARKMAYGFYKKACRENAERIRKIQEHFPGWVPEVSYNIKPAKGDREVMA